MKNKWLDWQPETQIIGQTAETQPAKPAKIVVPPAAVDVSNCEPAIPIAGSKTAVSQVSRGMLHHLAGRWLRERCVVTRLCASSMRGLGRNFCEWAPLNCDIVFEQFFAEELLERGFTPDESGMVSGLVLTEDLGAALKYEHKAYQSHVRSLTVGRR